MAGAESARPHPRRSFVSRPPTPLPDKIGSSRIPRSTARIEIASVAEQAPVGLLDDASGRLVVAKLIGRIDAHARDHLSASRGHDVEQVIDDTGARAEVTHLQVEGAVHAGGHGLDACAALAPQRLEERPHRRSAAPLGRMQNAPAVRHPR